MPLETVALELPKATTLDGVPRIPLDTLETARLSLDSPDWLTVSNGSLWVRLDTGHVVRVDPQSAKVIADIKPVGQSQFAACQAIGSGSAIWACGKQYVQRIDPESSTIVKQFEIDGSAQQGHLVVADDKAWLLSSDGRSLITISESTNDVGDPIELPAACRELAAIGDTLWAACPDDDAVLEIDAQSGAVTRKLGVEDPESVSAAKHLWVTAEAGVIQLDPDTLKVRAVFDVGDVQNADVSESAGLAWIRTEGGPFLVGIDAMHAHVIATITAPELPSGGNSALIDGQLWATAYDDATLVRLRPLSD